MGAGGDAAQEQPEESVGVGCGHGGPPVTHGSTRPLGLDDDDAVGAAHAVQRRLGGLLEDLDGLDVVGIYAGEGPVGTRVERYSVEDVQGRVAAPDGRAATD